MNFYIQNVMDGDDCIVNHDSPPCLRFAEDNKKLAAWISKKYKTETMAKWRRRKQND